jgi:hypothetical protein
MSAEAFSPIRGTANALGAGCGVDEFSDFAWLGEDRRLRHSREQDGPGAEMRHLNGFKIPYS